MNGANRGPQRERCFLLLQGPAGPFFQRLTHLLEARGHRVIRLVFSGGDLYDSLGQKRWIFSVQEQDLGAHLIQLAQEQKVTDLVVYGGTRPLHNIAIEALTTLGITAHVFEEGIIRPHWVTLESRTSHSPAVAELDRRNAPQAQFTPVGHTSVWTGWRYFQYYFCTLWLTIFFPRYRLHRPYPLTAETVLWGWRLICSPIRRRTAKQRWQRFHAQQCAFVAVPLQLEADSQIRIKGGGRTVDSFIDEVLFSFAQTAPSDLHLLFKVHPLDNLIIRWPNLIARRARELGVADRVMVLDGGSWAEVLRAARGVVTINSTAGLAALFHGCPTLALGEAIYKGPGLAADCSLEEFWTSCPEPDLSEVRALIAELTRRSQINGNFFTPVGLDTLMANLSRHPAFGPVEAQSEPAAPLGEDPLGRRQALG